MKTLSESIIGKRGQTFSTKFLQPGDIVCMGCRWGSQPQWGIVIPEGDRIIFLEDMDTTGIIQLTYYDGNLLHKRTPEFNIMQVWRDNKGQVPRKLYEARLSHSERYLQFISSGNLKSLIPKYNMEQIWKRN